MARYNFSLRQVPTMLALPAALESGDSFADRGPPPTPASPSPAPAPTPAPPPTPTAVIKPTPSWP
eukprot:1504900-Pyramimonas_sp.AAC.1